MALKKKPVTGMKDILPREMEIRDYVIQMIKDTYKTYGFMSMENSIAWSTLKICAANRAETMKNLFSKF